MWRSVWPLLAAHFAASVTMSIACALSLVPDEAEQRYVFTESEAALYATLLALLVDQTALIAIWFALAAERLDIRLAIAAGLYFMQWLCVSLAFGAYERLDVVAVALGAILGLSVPAFLFATLWRRVGGTQLAFPQLPAIKRQQPVQFGLWHLFAGTTVLSLLLAAAVQSRVILAFFTTTCAFSAMSVIPFGFVTALLVVILLSAKEDQFLSGMGESAMVAAAIGGTGLLVLAGLFSNLIGSIGFVFFVAVAWWTLVGTIWYLRQIGMRMTSVFDSI